MARLLYPAYHAATFAQSSSQGIFPVADFARGRDKRKRKSRKAILVGAGLLGGAALVGGGLLLKNKFKPKITQTAQPISSTGNVVVHEPVISHPSSSNTALNSGVIAKQQEYKHGSAATTNNVEREQARERIYEKLTGSASTRSPASEYLQLTKKQQNSAIIRVRRKLYEQELNEVNEAKHLKQDLDKNPGKFKSKRQGRYKRIRAQREEALNRIRQKFDQSQ